MTDTRPRHYVARRVDRNTWTVEGQRTENYTAHFSLPIVCLRVLAVALSIFSWTANTMTSPELISQTMPDGETITYGYASEGYLKTLTGGYTYLSAVQQDYLGRTSTVQYGSGITTTWQYDPTTLHTSSIVAGSVMSFAYTYDKVGNVKTKTDQLNSANNEVYTYDFMDRLFTATGVYGSKSYVYNKINNLLGMTGTAVNTYSSTQPHALIGDGTNTYTYDANGNMTAKKLSGTTIAGYTYDNQNRMTQVGMGANTTNFVYDDTRQRISKTDITASTNKTTIYWFDDFEQTFDNNSSGALIETTKSYSAYGKKIAQRTSSDSALLYLYQDHLSSTSVVTDNLGTVVSRLQYEPYGKLASVNNDKVKELFTGQDWDASIDLYYYNARYYNPNIGRFTQGDPAIVDLQFAVNLSMSEQLNPFMYCNNNPIVYNDPTGLVDSSSLDIGFDSYYETYVVPNTSWGSSGSSGYSSGGSSSQGTFVPWGSQSSPWAIQSVPATGNGIGDVALVGLAGIANIGTFAAHSALSLVGAAAGAVANGIETVGSAITKPLTGLSFTDAMIASGPIGMDLVGALSGIKIAASMRGVVAGGSVASAEANFAHYTSREAAEKIISSKILNPSSDTKFVEGMTMNATAKDALNSGARSVEVRIGLTVPPERIGMNPYTTNPLARMFQTQGSVNISQFNPVILSPAKPLSWLFQLFGQ